MLRILIADDDPTVRQAVQAVLARRGHAVEVADSADEARRMLANARFDIALIDARMPGDGATLRRELESGELNGRTILMTGDVAARAHEEDADPVLAKPFDYGVMVQLVEYLGRSAGPLPD